MIATCKHSLCMFLRQIDSIHKSFNKKHLPTVLLVQRFANFNSIYHLLHLIRSDSLNRADFNLSSISLPQIRPPTVDFVSNRYLTYHAPWQSHHFTLAILKKSSFTPENRIGSSSIHDLHRKVCLSSAIMDFHWYSTWINRSRTKRRHNNQRTLDQQHDIKNDFRSVIKTSEMEWNRTCLHRSQVNGRKSMSLHSSTLQCLPRSGNSGVPIRSYQNPKTLEENRRGRRRIGRLRWEVMWWRGSKSGF